MHVGCERTGSWVSLKMSLALPPIKQTTTNLSLQCQICYHGTVFDTWWQKGHPFTSPDFRGTPRDLWAPDRLRHSPKMAPTFWPWPLSCPRLRPVYCTRPLSIAWIFPVVWIINRWMRLKIKILAPLTQIFHQFLNWLLPVWFVWKKSFLRWMMAWML